MKLTYSHQIQLTQWASQLSGDLNMVFLLPRPTLLTTTPSWLLFPLVYSCLHKIHIARPKWIPVQPIHSISCRFSFSQLGPSSELASRERGAVWAAITFLPSLFQLTWYHVNFHAQPGIYQATTQPQIYPWLLSPAVQSYGLPWLGMSATEVCTEAFDGNTAVVAMRAHSFAPHALP